MKKIKLLYITLALVIMSCEDYLDINDDPFLPQTATPDLYLPQIVYSMAEGEMFDSRYVGAITQNWAWVNANNGFDRHASSNSSGTQKFRDHYWSIGSNLNEVAEQAEELGLADYSGIVNIIRAWSWQIVTDHHGELPFRQAWDNTRTSFDYDPQKDIYAGIHELCNQGIELLNNPTGQTDPKLADMEKLYNGDVSKWIKFAYAIKARNAHHISNKSSYDPAAVINFVDNSFESNEDNAEVPFDAESSATSSFMGPSRGNFNSRLRTQLIVSYLDGTYFNGVTDPRLSLMLNSDTDSTQNYIGVVPTLGDTTTNIRVPRLYGKYIFTDAAPYPLITYSELQFIKSEAAFIQNNLPLAYDAFLKAIQAHMDFTGVSPAEATQYLSTAIPQDASDLELNHIMMQKYISLYSNNETWSDLRRYQYDNTVYLGFTLPSEFAADNNGKPAQRWLLRRFSEYDWNSDALEKIGGLELDYHTKPIWFSTDEE
ncbi:SusD/RagB family nutrient-binding outer membrane lipoprotein [Fulvivirga sp. M361]|uniref:SusD/RagB family nutrient-binding outer membrane lipoprotein n=1 Tax=Fulvivirga sp. M361 TaxID=2594266 RepID=UPI00117BA74A|nr:SusD/RagB family nutrient-binding outer membrane lipoprotein [Fulvivirga sp. M361]TRX53017.1 SusD/RagB family nutrient-binding outer membrane lipoprotein [Fulvivirga sp. M361]